MPSIEPKVEYDPKNMIFRRLGSSGLRVPIFSLGGFLSFGDTVKGNSTRDVIKAAFDNGINMIDTAEGYANGQSEIEIGRVFKELGFRRTDWIICTKLFFGVRKINPNDGGLSRKHLIEGLDECLERLQVDYVDVVFAHRPDKTTTMVEVVRGFNHLINSGKALYWATSEWSPREIEEAYHVADEYKLIAPVADQCKYNCLDTRARVEVEYAPIFQKYGYGTTIFGALASGVLTGKYNNGIPEDSRFGTHKEMYRTRIAGENGRIQIEKVKALDELAKKELGCNVSQLALAWVAKNPNASTIIIGATRPEQLTENLKALDIIPKLTPEIYEKINKIVDNTPTPENMWGR